VSPVRVQLVVGQGPVRVDRVHGPVGQMLQVLGPEGDGEVGEQPFTGGDVGRVEPGPVDPVQRPGDDGHLLHRHQPVALRGRQLRPGRGQHLTQQADPLTAHRRREHPPGRLRR
jgi:hypothetical protein